MKYCWKIAYSDLHFKLTDFLGVATSDGLNTRIHQKLAALNTVIDFAVKHGCDEIFDFGDLFDSINPPSTIRNAYAKVIARALGLGIRVTRIPGNHETDGRDPDGLDASLLSGAQGLYYIAQGIEQHRDFDNLLLIPEVKLEEIASALVSPDNLVFGHFQVQGATFPNGLIAEDGIPYSLFGNRKFPMYLGHIHKRQEICSGVTHQPVAHHIGALTKKDFGDAAIPTGCCLFEIGYVDRQVEQVRHSYISIPDIGLHTLTFTEGAAPPSLVADEGDIVKLVYVGSHDWYGQQNVKEYIALITKLGVRVLPPDFRPVNEQSELSATSRQELDFTKLICEKAKVDNKNEEIGLYYFSRAQEALSGTSREL